MENNNFNEETNRLTSVINEVEAKCQSLSIEERERYINKILPKLSRFIEQLLKLKQREGNIFSELNPITITTSAPIGYKAIKFGLMLSYSIEHWNFIGEDEQGFHYEFYLTPRI